jgi:hypothetical protein
MPTIGSCGASRNANQLIIRVRALLYLQTVFLCWHYSVKSETETETETEIETETERLCSS